MEIYRKFFCMEDQDVLMQYVRSLPFKGARWPSPLGRVTLGWYRGENRGRLPGSVKTILRPALALSQQRWTTCFVQKYGPGQNVAPHRDPKDNLGHTVIVALGDFEAATFTAAERDYEFGPGDVIKLPCTINGVQGPVHSVSPFVGGTVRYSIIFNTIG